MKVKQPYPGTQAVLRALALLKVFTADQPEWSLSQLVKKLKFNKTTTFRLLSALESEGLLARSPGTENYTLGPEMIVLGSKALRSNNLRSVSRVELKSLAEAVGESSTLEILSGNEIVIIDEVLGDHLMGSVPSVGTRWLALATSTGKAIIANLPIEAQEALLRQPVPKFTTKTTTSPETLRKELVEAQKRGYAIADEALEIGYIAVGAPVRNFDREVIAAISVGGPNVRLTAKRIPQVAILVRESAARISDSLGYKRS
jgi:DNA-binding IclR family transcriptional regulator